MRPTQYIVIDKIGAEFDEAIYRINREDSVGLAVTGMNLGRHGKLCWIQVCNCITLIILVLYDQSD